MDVIFLHIDLEWNVVGGNVVCLLDRWIDGLINWHFVYKREE